MIEYNDCQCDEAVRNRLQRRPLEEVFPPNMDDEVVCAFCWEVLNPAEAEVC